MTERHEKIRYAVVGLGYIAQTAVLPAFLHATENSELVALVSDDPEKLKKLGRKYGVKATYSYEEYDDCLRNGGIDAVYITLPNHLHRNYTIRAAEAGIHVLCEKPMAITTHDCETMIQVCDENEVKLMIAYRLHFEEANLKAIETARSQLGDLRIFNSAFTMQVKEGNIRLKKEYGGGTLYDIGIYCINAARALFRDEPIEVFSLSAATFEERFREVEEMTGAILLFPGERLAGFTCSFGAADVSMYQIIGTQGSLRVEPAYEIAETLKQFLTVKQKTRVKTFSRRDQFSPELLYFSKCILEDSNPEPSGREGLLDVRIIEALYRSAKTGQSVPLPYAARDRRPDLRQEIHFPPVKKARLIHAEPPHGG